MPLSACHTLVVSPLALLNAELARSPIAEPLAFASAENRSEDVRISFLIHLHDEDNTPLTNQTRQK